MLFLPIVILALNCILGFEGALIAWDLYQDDTCWWEVDKRCTKSLLLTVFFAEMKQVDRTQKFNSYTRNIFSFIINTGVRGGGNEERTPRNELWRQHKMCAFLFTEVLTQGTMSWDLLFIIYLFIWTHHSTFFEFVIRQFFQMINFFY